MSTPKPLFKIAALFTATLLSLPSPAYSARALAAAQSGVRAELRSELARLGPNPELQTSFSRTELRGQKTRGKIITLTEGQRYPISNSVSLYLMKVEPGRVLVSADWFNRSEDAGGTIGETNADWATEGQNLFLYNDRPYKDSPVAKVAKIGKGKASFELPRSEARQDEQVSTVNSVWGVGAKKTVQWSSTNPIYWKKKNWNQIHYIFDAKSPLTPSAENTHGILIVILAQGKILKCYLLAVQPGTSAVHFNPDNVLSHGKRVQEFLESGPEGFGKDLVHTPQLFEFNKSSEFEPEKGKALEESRSVKGPFIFKFEEDPITADGLKAVSLKTSQKRMEKYFPSADTILITKMLNVLSLNRAEIRTGQKEDPQVSRLLTGFMNSIQGIPLGAGLTAVKVDLDQRRGNFRHALKASSENPNDRNLQSAAIDAQKRLIQALRSAGYQPKAIQNELNRISARPEMRSDIDVDNYTDPKALAEAMAPYIAEVTAGLKRLGTQEASKEAIGIITSGFTSDPKVAIHLLSQLKTTDEIAYITGDEMYRAIANAQSIRNARQLAKAVLARQPFLSSADRAEVRTASMATEFHDFRFPGEKIDTPFTLFLTSVSHPKGLRQTKSPLVGTFPVFLMSQGKLWCLLKSKKSIVFLEV